MAKDFEFVVLFTSSRGLHIDLKIAEMWSWKMKAGGFLDFAATLHDPDLKSCRGRPDQVEPTPFSTGAAMRSSIWRKLTFFASQRR
jgi:hypothetical protein